MVLGESVVRQVGLVSAMGSSLTQSSWINRSTHHCHSVPGVPIRLGDILCHSVLGWLLGWLQDMLCLPRQGVEAGPEHGDPLEAAPQKDFMAIFWVSVLRKHSK